MSRYLIVDGHEDIAWNTRVFGRDYTQSAYITRRRERGTSVERHNGNTLLGRTEWLIGRVGIFFGTIFVAPVRRKLGDWDTQCYNNQQEAYALANQQIQVYWEMVERDPTFQLITNQDECNEVLATWGDDKDLGDRKIGIVILMEGADPIVEPERVTEWYEFGLRILGLAWAGTRYSGGTYEPGGLTRDGIQLLNVMAGLDMILDLSHMAEEAYYQALDHYDGTVIVSHANSRRFIRSSRGLSVNMVERVAERNGVIGVVPYNRFLDPGWHRSDPKEAVNLDTFIDAIDDICQITGSANCVAIGSDFDGGFGMEHTPAEIDTVADLQKIPPLLKNRGFSNSEIANVMGLNWVRILNESLPAES